ncbi:HutD family protein [Rhizobium sp. KVB221]|uniref:HutD family protein n=1 Tax=Rhizobium setariae TaxID=2801340 RepID=A0A936YQ69_9HYPH|nr:HutD family protein [Rhizobium setariae]MBL0372476.1 HutD family protein [Rhizobium setariae]
MRILKHSDHKRMPWKNGQGVTEEVASFPPGSDISNFGWRLSIAHVGADGPFSVFAGIDRTIALLDGDGLCLDLPDSTKELDPKGEPFAFSGDLDISSRNKGGPTIDLNIMTRRGQFRHVMRRFCGEPIVSDDEDAVRLFVFNATTSMVIDGQAIVFDRFDALLLGEANSNIALTGHAVTDVLAITIYRVD